MLDVTRGSARVENSIRIGTWLNYLRPISRSKEFVFVKGVFVKVFDFLQGLASVCGPVALFITWVCHKSNALCNTLVYLPIQVVSEKIYLFSVRVKHLGGLTNLVWRFLLIALLEYFIF